MVTCKVPHCIHRLFLKHALLHEDYPAPQEHFIALCTDSKGTEVRGLGYERQRVFFTPSVVKGCAYNGNEVRFDGVAASVFPRFGARGQILDSVSRHPQAAPFVLLEGMRVSWCAFPSSPIFRCVRREENDGWGARIRT